MLHPSAPSLIAAALLAAAALPAPQDPGRGMAPDAPPAPLYPADRHEVALRFFTTDGNVDEEQLDEALAQLDDPDAYVFFGPAQDTVRPNSDFLAVEAKVADVEAKDVERAIKKSGGKPETLVWTMVTWNPTEPPRPGGRGGRLAGGVRSRVLTASSDIRWCEAIADRVVFFYERGGIDAEKVIDKFEKIFTASGMKAEELGVRVAVDTIEWKVVGELDQGLAKRIEKDIGELDGVTTVSLDPTTKLLRIHVRLEDLALSGPPHSGPGGDEAGGGRNRAGAGARYVFFTDPVLDVLEEHELEALDPGADAAPEPAEQPGG